MKINHFKENGYKENGHTMIEEIDDGEDRQRDDLLIIAALNGETAKRFVIPVASIEECLDAADVAYLCVMAYLKRRLDKTAQTEVIRSMVGTY